MVKMSRAGRKSMMFKAIMAWDRKHKGGALTTAKMAHAAGLKSSSNVLSMLREMEAFARIREVSIETSRGSGKFIRAWQLVSLEQMTLPDEYIVINGVKWNKRIGVEVETSSGIQDYSSECSNCGKPMSYRRCGMCTTCEMVWNL